LNASHADRGTVLVVQHVACETLGTIEDVVRAQRLTPRYVRVHEGDPIPSRWDDSCGLIVMGGPMSVEDSGRLPHLAREMRLIESAQAADRPVLGVCLGSQLLAHVLGSKVSSSPRKEIGWHRVRLRVRKPQSSSLATSEAASKDATMACNPAASSASNRSASGLSMSSTPRTRSRASKGRTISEFDVGSHAMCPGNS
jgi:GMP synthase-like glutamine amidotransferase